MDSVDVEEPPVEAATELELDPPLVVELPELVIVVDDPPSVPKEVVVLRIVEEESVSEFMGEVDVSSVDDDWA